MRTRFITATVFCFAKPLPPQCETIARFSPMLRVVKGTHGDTVG